MSQITAIRVLWIMSCKPIDYSPTTSLDSFVWTPYPLQNVQDVSSNVSEILCISYSGFCSATSSAGLCVILFEKCALHIDAKSPVIGLQLNYDYIERCLAFSSLG